MPERVTTTGHASYPGTLKAEWGEAIPQRTTRSLHHPLEQDHGGVKQRTQPMWA